MAIEVYNQTPASNDMANYFQTGMAPSKVKNAGWDIMADMAQQLLGMPTTGGTANAQTATNTRQFGSLVAGMMQYVVFGATNTAAMTFAPDGLTAKNVFANGAAALAGQIVSGQIGILKYDGTQWNLLNPSRATGSFTETLATGLTTTPTGTVNYSIDTTGKGVDIWITGVTGTSNATGLTATGIPAIIQPATTKTVCLVVVDSANAAAGALVTGTSGTWTYGKPGTAAFTNTGTKGLPAAAANCRFTLD